MGRFISDLLRAVADGWDQAAGRDPVDEHAAQAVDVVNGHGSGAIRVGRGRAFWDWGPEMAQLPPAAKVRHLEDMLSAALLDRDKVAEEAKVLAAENRELRRKVDDPDEVVVTAAPDVVVDAALELAGARMEAVSAREQLDMLTANVARLASYFVADAKGHREEAMADDATEADTTGELARAEAYSDAAARLRAFVDRTTDWTGRPLDAKLAEKNADPADTAKAGDHLGEGWDSAPSSLPLCKAPSWEGLRCTRSCGHSGQHVATGGNDRALAVWPNEAAPVADASLPADVQAVVDAARAYQKLFYGWAGRGSILGKESNAVIDAVTALDGPPPGKTVEIVTTFSIDGATS